MKNKFDISIIIPVYNAEEFIYETLNSIYTQKCNLQIEVILINDGSEDNSIACIKKFIKENHKENINYSIYNDGENLGQGARRNFGIDVSRGETILFLDSDDFLVKDALEIAYTRFKGNNENDFVIFEWAYYYPETQQTVYVNKERYSQKLALYRKTCELLLSCTTYFSVNKLYKREFLVQHDIRFGEGYIYEDFEFYVKCALRAWRVPVIPNILYKVRIHENSTTKTEHKGLKHRDSFLKAIEKSSLILHNEGTRDINSVYNVNKYFIYRALLYSEKRLPKSKRIRNDFIKKSMQIINQYSYNMHIPDKIIPLYYHAFQNKLIENLNVKEMKKVFKLHRTGKLNFYSHRVVRKKRKKKLLKQRIESNYYLEPLVYFSRRQVHKIRKNRTQKKENKLLSKDILSGTILMLGFDYKYLGNSKYLFDYLKTKYSPSTLKFVSFDKNIPDEYRVTPRSDEFFKLFYSSQYIIAESWIPLAFKKKTNQVWIQLWHGTPFKKMVFDSSESYMIRLNPNHKVRIKKDIERWDYLLSDSLIAKKIFNTSFDFPKDKILNYGYPRNEWLVKNAKNENLINELKIKNHIPRDKKVILYAPTWRDYNYKKAENKKDNNYIANLEMLLNNLGNDYVIINKSHSMDKQSLNTSVHSQILTVNSSIDSQELILLSDIIITDYSSIFLDAIHINKPFYFITKDLSKFNLTRGFYNEIYKDFSSLFARTEKELANKIKINGYSNVNIDSKYKNKLLDRSSELINEIIKNNKPL
ncbi:CDP-glycerol glycerophosphotransferase family protein [Staphylococcus haemolyticus]|uniref:bifunctional glycosyltransferase/CDP-glycerol:glycerophosphate glycerophosphotransferase n=1 Tax=Staphylococcus haemolyticus TaxID=1283 RepID=UPI0018792556|nr:CDP-glycerol glycerophosphotransferase family protein [Staphylococcus haemolyticus]MBE7356558.1 CDP-glycerol glycerophosphotransferase family protein [Staphylococcus haemolyticus]MDT0705029.1 CDP-glycerol glycerophosphotransferase family protein [Staphylococcus haemolyticus]MDT0738007.1 CDP-glycerol glycerophosphotransferase family protein [Staphylococcus haemolyticus]